MINGNDLDRARDALYSIPADLPREEWVKLGMAFQDAGGGFDDFDRWSASAPSYDTQSCRATWRSFKSGKGISVGTLFAVAVEHGWTYGDKPEQRPIQAPTKPVELPRLQAPGMDPTEVWNRCETATNAHPYVIKKNAVGVPLGHLRVVPAGDDLTIMGEYLGGALVVPVMQPDGSISSLQFITANNKLNLPGHAVNGRFIVGELAPDGVAYLCEGIGTAWACWLATGAAAVVCFGWGNIEKVAVALREQFPSSRLVIVPDVGKESNAQRIASELGGYVASMPEGWEKNSDVNDLMQRDGVDAVMKVLEAASEPLKTPHPLAIFVQFDETPKAPRWTIPGFIGHGVTLISGAHGAGKTTALLPLAMTAAGLHGGELLPSEWRHVVYITEDVEQAQRILTGIVKYGNLGLDWAVVKERIHFVEAVRLVPAYVATVGATYKIKFTRKVKGVEVLPLVVLDTKSAVLALEKENDNSEASAMMATLKQDFQGIPVWLIGHVAKASLTRSDVSAMSTRGASAVDSDAHQTIFLVRDGVKRFLLEGKTRFDPKWSELEVVSYSTTINANDEFGQPEIVTLRWGISTPSQTTRKQSQLEAKEQAKKDGDANLRREIRDAVDTASNTGKPLNREGVKEKLRHKNTVVGSMIDNLISENFLYEVTVPKEERTHPKRSTFLVSLSTVEQEAYVRAGVLPEEKLVVPVSWKKPVSSIPAPESEKADLVA